MLFSSVFVALAGADTCSDCTAVVNAIQVRIKKIILKIYDDADIDLNDLLGEAHV